jgi:pyrophosphate--fructose-6-phosphate 1-phosphotransferase
MPQSESPLSIARRAYRPVRPQALTDLRAKTLAAIEDLEPVTGAALDDTVQSRFPAISATPYSSVIEGGEKPETPPRVGVLLSGGQAAGGHNVIAGLFEALREMHHDAVLIGFRGGPRGLLQNDTLEIDADQVDRYRNSGGFDWIGSGRDKIESDDQIETAQRVVDERKLDGLVIIGGDDSNTNAAILEEAFRKGGSSTSVVGVPKTIDGDLRGGPIEMSFGFDTATAIYSELIGNIARDAASAGKYWHFIKLMGRSASHVTLECALACRPNLTWIGDEVRENGWTLDEIVRKTAEAIESRAEHGRNYGVCLIPEGLIEFIPEMQALLAGLNDLMAKGTKDRIAERLDEAQRKTFLSIPPLIREQLLADRDSHGNVQVSLIQTERLLVEAVREKLKQTGSTTLRAHTHFFGYEGRCGFPTNFDSDYTQALGRLAGLCVTRGLGGVLVALQDLSGPVESWRPIAVPLARLIHLEMRHGAEKPVIEKALVELDGAPFRSFSEQRAAWLTSDCYSYPGPIQFGEGNVLADRRTHTLLLEQGS